ncbi:Methyltransferase domain-containing protein [Pseudovibrio ascidiaceicola]|uniref:Methyltransferase domain-containing protein n=1 Tax=Pseudovibrio ascidiaceicola TaxID=285279 RepID=A0A1I4DHK6_9HYPH|nr:class I SAM-dependent methyltransferase [Pseudovibrio ascidiaceicola]SFK91371.1 Methyltransferase domain-containing protein [Pseudovibrio ascidiaceicola]
MEELSDDWDRQYEAGRWHFLNDIKEAARYGILSAWLGQTGTTRAVLDVGCGEAILYHYLKSSGLQRYCGVDLSEIALGNANVAEECVQLVQSDLESFNVKTADKFSAIVFNEVLYFCEEPELQLNRYAKFLEDNGVIAISMYTPAREKSGANRSIQKVWSETDKSDHWKVLDDLELKSCSKNVGWKLRLVRPVR